MSIATPEAPRTGRRLPPLRYGVLALALVIVATVVTVEIRRHQALGQLKLRDDALVHFEVEWGLPQAVTSRLPDEVADAWWVSMKSCYLDLSDPSASGGELLLLQRFPEVCELTLILPDLDAARLKQLSRLTKLEKLEICCRTVSGGWESLDALRQLRTLSINAQRIAPDGLVGLNTLQSLTRLSLAGDILGAEQFGEITRLKNLETLELDAEDSFQGDLADLGGSTNLRRLHVMFPNARPLDGLAKLTQLTHLQVSVDGLSDKHLKLFLPLENLERLSISTFGEFGKGLATLEQLPHLQELILEPSSISMEGLQTLIKFRPLRMVVLDSFPMWPFDFAVGDPAVRTLAETLEKRPGFERSAQFELWRSKSQSLGIHIIPFNSREQRDSFFPPHGILE